VVSTGGIEAAHGLLWVVMITSAENRGWPGDLPIADLGRAGLPAPSIIRPAKIATIEARDAEPIGTVPAEVTAAVLERIVGELGR
jgi:mRNA interferase MazF